MTEKLSFRDLTNEDLENAFKFGQEDARLLCSTDPKDQNNDEVKRQYRALLDRFDEDGRSILRLRHRRGFLSF